jgi:peptidyl-prolyl cis-trans isomerase SurA
MHGIAHRARWYWVVVAAVCAMMPALGAAQNTPQASASSAAAGPVAPIVPAAPAVAVAPVAHGVLLDRIVAVVNGEVILESDVDEERRFEEIEPYHDARVIYSRDRAIQRLIDRALILQQAALEPEEAVSDTELDAQLARVQSDIPECKQYHCETPEGWATLLRDHGFTVKEFRDRWKKRMELLKFIEVRFRNGVKISEDEIKTYYTKTMMPEYAKRNATAPKLPVISKRIEEVLLEQEVGELLEDWLKSLRAQGSVKVMTPGEVMP